tara:strand:+ start:497 stop:925 length:429 start_codon:yes stop_codon:yes gene_type:complete
VGFLKKILILSSFFLFFPSTGTAEFAKWNSQDQRMYESFVTLQAMDLLQTFAMIECQERNPYCPYYETNPLVGKYPSKGEVVLIKLGMNYLIYNMLDKKMSNRERRGTLIALNTISVFPVIQNESIGLGFYIPILPYKSFRK